MSPIAATDSHSGKRKPAESAAVESQACYGKQLSAKERGVIQEELDILQRVRRHLKPQTEPQVRKLDADMLELRDSIATATTEDRAQLVAQMISLSQLAKHAQNKEVEGVLHPESPYFGHLRIQQDNSQRDVLIGNANLMNSDAPMPIVNWYHAPISRVFYRCEEGEWFEEDFGGRLVEGQVLLHRRLVIEDGLLLRIDCAQGSFQWINGGWRANKDRLLTLEGGQGSAPRPEAISFNKKGEPSLGVGVSGSGDRRLASIRGLLDEAQFNLITDSTSKVMVIDGGAGSGKTTVALHRMAFLAQSNPQRFPPKRMMAVVFSQAMAAYISHFLPALGVHNCRIEVYENLMQELRRRHFPHLPVGYRSSTPTIAWQFKQDPICLQLLLAAAEERLVEWKTDLQNILGEAPQAAALLAGWDAMEGAYAQRPRMFLQWVQGSQQYSGSEQGLKVPPQLDQLSQQRLKTWADALGAMLEHPERFVLEVWSEAFLRLPKLEQGVKAIAPQAYTSEQLKALHEHLFSTYSNLHDWLEWRVERAQHSQGVDALDEETLSAAAPSKLLLDREDDTLLLLLFEALVGPLRFRKRPLQLAHITVDEAQDFALLELQLLLKLAEQPLSLTLAGDTEQRVILHHAPKGWEEILQELGLIEQARMRQLEVGYRGTKPVMDLARHVLGDLHQGRPWRAVRDGPPVLLLRAGNVGLAVSFLSKALNDLTQREPQASIALIARYEAQAVLFHQGLQHAGMPNLHLVLQHDFSFRPGIEITTVLQVKGLEFDYVVLLELDAASWPDEVLSRYLLHVAATRASHQLWLLCCGTPSPLLPDDLPMSAI